MATALVTGSTSGIGAAFVRYLSTHGFGLVLVARNAGRLEEQAAGLRAQGVEAEVVVADLADRDQLRRVEERLADPARPVDLLVNNAGFGLRTPFLAPDLESEQGMIDVMVTAVMRLSHAAARAMTQRGSGAIVTTSSVAGFLPSGSYSAAKAYATALTEALDAELRGTGVRAMALCPGFTRTEFHERGRMRTDAVPGLLWLDADAVVAAAMSDLRRGRVVSVPGWQYKVVAAALAVTPRPLVRRLARGGSPTKVRT